MVFPYDIPWVTPNALTDDECDYIRELATPNLEWSVLSPSGHMEHSVGCEGMWPYVQVMKPNAFF